MKTSIGLAILLLLLLYCYSLEPLSFEGALKKEKLTTADATPLALTLEVPIKHSLHISDQAITVDLNPNGRRIKQFTISKKNNAEDSIEYKDEYHFKNGAILQYTLATKEGGSAGPEYILKGQLSYSDSLYIIDASEQKEWGKGDPKFCLKYLSTLE